MGNRAETGDGADSVAAAPTSAAQDAPLAGAGLHDLRSERLVDLGELSVLIAHEVNGCLAALRLHLTAAQALAASAHARLEPEASRRLAEALDGANECSDRIAGLMDAIQRYGRPEPVRLERVQLDEVARVALRLTAPLIARAGQLELALKPTAPVAGHQSGLVQVAVNLLRNAADALCETQRPHDSRCVTITTDSDATSAILRVQDNGPGMAPELQARVMEPYFTTKSAERGWGLGLAICKEIVAAHGGELRLDSTPGGGTRVEARLPLAPRLDAG